MTIDVIRDNDRTPVILFEIPSTTNYSNKDETILLYGHMDKQPPLTDQWTNGLHPYTPILKVKYGQTTSHY